MRWKKKSIIFKDDDGKTKRIKEKFLLWPRCIENEWRWLEKAKFEQIGRRERYINSFAEAVWIWSWTNKRWIDE